MVQQIKLPKKFLVPTDQTIQRRRKDGTFEAVTIMREIKPDRNKYIPGNCEQKGTSRAKRFRRQQEQQA